MLPKINRADRSAVEKVFQSGRSVSSPSLNFKFLKIPNQKKISVVVSKTVIKSAVKRNTLRRRGYQALGKIFSKFPEGINGALVLKSPTLSLSELEKEITIILSKLK